MRPASGCRRRRADRSRSIGGERSPPPASAGGFFVAARIWRKPWTALPTRGARSERPGEGKPASRRGTLGEDEYRNFSERHPSVLPLLHPPRPAAPASPSPEAGRRASLNNRELRHQEGRRGSQPPLHVPPDEAVATAWVEHATVMMGEIDCTIRCRPAHGTRDSSDLGRVRSIRQVTKRKDPGAVRPRGLSRHVRTGRRRTIRRGRPAR
jgi:hypothetical protein